MVDTGCPRTGYRHIAFHSRDCVEPQRSGREERTACVSMEIYNIKIHNIKHICPNSDPLLS